MRVTRVPLSRSRVPVVELVAPAQQGRSAEVSHPGRTPRSRRSSSGSEAQSAIPSTLGQLRRTLPRQGSCSESRNSKGPQALVHTLEATYGRVDKDFSAMITSCRLRKFLLPLHDPQWIGSITFNPVCAYWSRMNSTVYATARSTTRGSMAR